MCGVVPVICEPFFTAESVEITPMNAGSGPAGCGALLPGSVLHVSRHVDWAGLFAKPLNDAGAVPPLRTFRLAHWAPQKVTALPLPLEPSPTTNEPRPGASAKTSIVHFVASALLPPTPSTWTRTSEQPVAAYVCAP